MAHSNTTGPSYYRRGTIQTWDFIRDQGLNFHLGNAVKYICRAGYKDSRAEDLKKAIHYLTNELETTTGQRFKEFLDAENQLIMGLTVNSAECLKELADLVYVCYQYAENLDWDLDKALDRVHESNLSKLGEDGNPIYREDGKVLKGPNYQPPNLTDLV
jgi:predicted HAD superfamily Cof-like phosphohydrolase